MIFAFIALTAYSIILAALLIDSTPSERVTVPSRRDRSVKAIVEGNWSRL